MSFPLVEAPLNFLFRYGVIDKCHSFLQTNNRHLDSSRDIITSLVYQLCTCLHLKSLLRLKNSFKSKNIKASLDTLRSHLELWWDKNFAIFGNVTHNLDTSDGFAQFVKVRNHTGLWDSEFAWYSPCVTHQICLYGWKQGLEIHAFKPSCHCTVIICTFTFHTTNVSVDSTVLQINSNA